MYVHTIMNREWRTLILIQNITKGNVLRHGGCNMVNETFFDMMVSSIHLNIRKISEVILNLHTNHKISTMFFFYFFVVVFFVQKSSYIHLINFCTCICTKKPAYQTQVGRDLECSFLSKASILTCLALAWRGSAEG